MMLAILLMNVFAPLIDHYLINANIKRRVKRKGQRWGAYTSGNLVQAYKRAGGKYSGRKKSFIKSKSKKRKSKKTRRKRR